MNDSFNKTGSYTPHWIERMFSILAAFFILILVAYIVVRGDPLDRNTAVLVRTILSLCVAVFGGTIPGFLNIEYSSKGIMIRASGALALFVITYFFTPTVFSGKFPHESPPLTYSVPLQVVDLLFLLYLILENTFINVFNDLKKINRILRIPRSVKERYRNIGIV